MESSQFAPSHATELTHNKGTLPWLVLLNGTSCSGKTTLPRELQRRLSLPRRPFLHIEADRFVPYLPGDLVDGSLAVPMNRALSRAIACFADQGFDIIVDGVLLYGHPGSIADALSIFRRYRLRFIGVHCDLEVLEQRERRRADRIDGWARRQYKDIHEATVYDIEVDTTTTGADENADRISQYMVRLDTNLVGTIQEQRVDQSLYSQR